MDSETDWLHLVQGIHAYHYPYTDYIQLYKTEDQCPQLKAENEAYSDHLWQVLVMWCFNPVACQNKPNQIKIMLDHKLNNGFLPKAKINS